MSEQLPDSLGARMTSGSAFVYGSFMATKVAAFVTTLVLVRLLTPRDFGLVGFALVVLGLLDVVKNLGITSALIYRQDIRDEDAGEAFVLAVGMAVILFVACWLVAPLAGSFFRDSRAVLVTRVLGVTLLLDALGGVHSALLQKRLRFKRFVVPDLVLSLSKGSVAVVAAALGAGYWSLVWGQLTGVALWTITNWCLYPWLPRLHLRWASARRLVDYGVHILLVDLLGAVVLTADNLIVGRVLGARALGLYAVAFTIAQFLTISLASAVSSAIFPAFAMVQGDRPTLQRYYLAVQHYTALVLVPVGFGLCSIAPALVHALFGRAWWPMVPVLQLLAISTMLQALAWNAGDTYKSVGRPDILWKQGLVQAPALVGACLLGAHLDGIVGVAIARIVVAVPFAAVSWWWVQRVLALDRLAIAKTMRVPLFVGGVVFGLTELTTWTLAGLLPAGAVLALQILIGTTAYGLLVLRGESDARILLRSWLRPAVSPAGSYTPTHLS